MNTNGSKNIKKIKDKSLSKDIKHPPDAKGKDKKPDHNDNSELRNINIPVSSHQPKRKSVTVSKVNKSGIKLSKSENVHPELEIQHMEVHHHPQLNHKPKHWKEYILEGFMIFIAVMMGFVAENIREYITDNQHARDLTLQLVHDLKADTVELDYIYLKESQIVKYNDTLFTLLQQPLKNIDTRRIQKLAAKSHSMWPFHASSGAIAAIKNELHLKQFSNSQIISYFSEYERDIELLHTAQDINLQYQRIYLDPFITLHFTPANMVAAFNNKLVPTAQMRNLQQSDVDQLAADMVLIRIVSQEMLTHNRGLKLAAEDMLHYVLNHYNLKAE